MEYNSIPSKHETLELAVESRMACLDNWIVKGCIVANKAKHFLIPVFLEFILKLHFKFITDKSFKNNFKNPINDEFSFGTCFFITWQLQRNIPIFD